MEQYSCLNTVIHLMFRDFTFYFYCIKDSPLKRGNFLWKLEKEQDTFHIEKHVSNENENKNEETATGIYGQLNAQNIILVIIDKSIAKI